jgi:hypothetical protein
MVPTSEVKRGHEKMCTSLLMCVAFDVDFSRGCESNLWTPIGHTIMQRPLRLGASLTCQDAHRCLRLRYSYSVHLDFSNLMLTYHSLLDPDLLGYSLDF